MTKQSRLATETTIEDVKAETKSFYAENKEAIHTIVFIGAVILINKRIVRSVVRKEVSKLAFVMEFIPSPDTTLGEASKYGTLAVTQAS